MVWVLLYASICVCKGVHVFVHVCDVRACDVRVVCVQCV